MAKKKRAAPSVSIKEQSRIFVAEVHKLANKYPDLKGQFAIATPRRASSGRALAVAEASPRRCLAWGTDPVTGKRICIRWG